jgi:hypothetical protein
MGTRKITRPRRQPSPTSRRVKDGSKQPRERETGNLVLKQNLASVVGEAMNDCCNNVHYYSRRNVMSKLASGNAVLPGRTTATAGGLALLCSALAGLVKSSRTSRRRRRRRRRRHEGARCSDLLWLEGGEVQATARATAVGTAQARRGTARLGT